MGIIEEGQQYLVRVAVKKIVYGIAKGSLGILTYAKSQAIQQQFGITVDPVVFQAGVTTATLALLSFIHDWARVHYPALANWI